jgi:hypothetical protein
MALRRLLGVIMLVIVTSAALVVPASADHTYAPPGGAIQVSKTVVTQGQSVDVRATGFCANRRVRVTVTSKNHESTFRESADSKGVVDTTIRLTNLGRNTITITGCQKGGGTQSLSAHVRVVAHKGRGHVNDSNVHKGDWVRFSARGFCYSHHHKITPKLLDDGVAYQRSKADTVAIRSDSRGRVSTRVKLNRVGTTTLILTGCRHKGGTQSPSVSIRVRKATSQSFAGSSAAYVGNVATGVPAAAYAGLGGLLALFVGGQVLIGRRRRSE